MSDQNTNPETLRKRNSKTKETASQREARLARDRERKRQKRTKEMEENHETRLRSVRERRIQRQSTETAKEREHRLNRENERKRDMRVRVREHTRNERVEQRQNINEPINELINEPINELINEPISEPNRHVDAEQTFSDNEPNVQERTQRDNNYSDIPVIPISATTISEEEHYLLKDFCKQMDNIDYKVCNVCNERIPFMKLTKKFPKNLLEETCNRCYSEETSPKKFSAGNNMDPGEVPEELRDLTEIEEMLIAQVFTVVSVYRLRGGQHGYRGNVINFPQDIQEFTKQLPRQPSSLDVLVVRRQTANEPTAFRDFIVRREKVARALLWLKKHNGYYKDITIDNEILQTLPENGSVFNILPHLQND